MEAVGVTCFDAAVMLAVPITQVYKLVKSGKLRTYGDGRGLRVLVASIDAYKNTPAEPRIIKPLVKEPDKAKGFVYLIRLGLYHKIGIARNVRKRISSMQSGYPDEFELVHTVPTNDMRRAELFLHERFAAQRVRGEWFGLQPEHVTSVCEYESLMF